MTSHALRSLRKSPAYALTAILVAITTISAMLPARRAARTSPHIALRDE